VPITNDVKPGEMFQMAEGLCRFVREEGHNVMVFKRDGTGKEIYLPEHKFNERHGKRELRKVVLGNDGHPISIQEFGPGEAWTDTADPAEARLTPDGQRAAALQFYTKKWDELDKRPLGGVGLQEHIDRYRPTAIGLGYEPSKGEKGYLVEVATLRRCIHNCGRPGERPLAAFRSMRGKGSRKRFDDIVEKLLAETVTFFYSERSRDYNDAYAYFRPRIDAINRKRDPEDQLKFPKKPEVIRRRIDKAKCFANWAMKYNRQAAYKKFKGQADHIRATWPLELTIMDSTTFDAFMVLDTETYLPLGRPTLTVCLDVATRMVLGYLISFEAPSLYSALTVLKRVNKNKRYVARLYPHITREWDGWGRPVEILLDLAWEHKAPSFQHSMSNLGTDIIWAPADTPEYKSIGERVLGTVNTWMAKKLPGGTINPILMRRVGLDPQKDAVIRLSDMDALMHEFIVGYNYEKHTGIGAVPARVWHDKLLINKRPWISDIAALDNILGRVETVTLTNSGIKFKNMRFHDQTLTGLLLDDLVKDAKKRSQSPIENTPSRIKVIIKWNPADAGSIVVWNHAAKHYVTLPNRDPDFYQGISFWHVEQLREFAEQQDLDFSSEADRWKARDELRQRYEELAGKLPLRESRDARRNLAFSQGTFDDTTVNEMPDITIDNIVDSEAEPSTAGMNEPEGVSDELAAYLLDPKNEPPKGRTPGKKSVAKAQRTKQANKEKREAEQHKADVKRQGGDPTGEPAERSAPVEDDYAGGKEWGDPESSEVASVEEDSTAETETDDDYATGAEWGD
jgi:putative transposase